MDQFEMYLFDKITDYRQRLESNTGDEAIAWALNNSIEEFMEILAQYTLNNKAA